MNNYLETHLKKIEEALKGILPCENEDYKVICDAMKYSIIGGGKRIRPVLMMEFCRVCGGNPDSVINLGLALECIHTYSLIHDDLPCMDNDDMRRGKPSCHKAFGETNALLAGDGLLTYAFLLAAESKNIDSKALVNCIKVLADNAGYGGMVGGQVIDLMLEQKIASEKELTDMYNLKTGKLIEAACAIGCIAAGADDGKIGAAKKYAKNIGLAFQIIDDALDCVGDANKLGKPIGSDSKNNKTTFVSLYGVEGCYDIAKQLTNEAIEALNCFDDAEELKEFAIKLIKRDH